MTLRMMPWLQVAAMNAEFERGRKQRTLELQTAKKVLFECGQV